MRAEIDEPCAQGVQVFLCGFCLGNAAIIFQSAQRGDDDDRARREIGTAAFDVKKLLRAEIGAKARLRDAVITKLQSKACRRDRIAAVGDIGKWPAMHQDGRVFKRLHKIGLDGVFEQRRHGSGHAQIARINGGIVIFVGDQNAAEPFFQVCEIVRQAEDRHDLARYRDLEAVLARHTIDLAAQAYDAVPQRPVIHIHAAFQYDMARIDAELVPLLEMVVNAGAQKIIRRSDGVHIAGEMEVDVLHWDSLRIAAAGRAALDAENRAERGLPQGDNRIFLKPCHGLSKADRCRRFSLAGGRGVDGGDKDQLTVRLAGEPFHNGRGELRLIAAVGLQLLLFDSQPLRDLLNG